MRVAPAAGPEHSDAAVDIELLAADPDQIEVLAYSAYSTRARNPGRAQRDHQAVAAAPAVPGGFTHKIQRRDRLDGLVHKHQQSA